MTPRLTTNYRLLRHHARGSRRWNKTRNFPHWNKLFNSPKADEDLIAYYATTHVVH